MSKIKAVMPSLREKKRYLAFEVISEQKVSFNDVSKAVNKGISSFIGKLGAAAAGPIMLKEKYDADRQRGVLRVANSMVDKIRGSFCLIDKVGQSNAIIRSVGVSGSLKTAYQKYIGQ